MILNTELLFRPLDDLVMVEKVGEDELTVGGLHIPENIDEENKLPRWKVIATGPGHAGPGGVWVKPEVAVGDVVVLSSKRGQMFKIPNRRKDTMLVDSRCVLAVIGGEGAA